MHQGWKMHPVLGNMLMESPRWTRFKGSAIFRETVPTAQKLHVPVQYPGVRGLHRGTALPTRRSHVWPGESRMLPMVLQAQGTGATLDVQTWQAKDTYHQYQHRIPSTRTNTKYSSPVPGPRLRINTQYHSQYQSIPDGDPQHRSTDAQRHSQHKYHTSTSARGTGVPAVGPPKKFRVPTQTFPTPHPWRRKRNKQNPYCRERGWGRAQAP